MRKRFGPNWLALPLVISTALLCMGQACPAPPAPAPPSPTTGNSGVTGQYIGADVCVTCHQHQHDNWAMTLHASALDTLEAIGQGTNPACIGCHTVGYGKPGGFVDRATTNVLAGVGCEDCHGPAREHVMNVNEESLRPPVNISADVCGQCHTGSHHPNYEDWSMSAHATVVEHVAESLVAGEEADSCGLCHSGDSFYKVVIDGQTIAPDAYQGLSIDDLNGITCADCHDPHMRTGNAVNPGAGRDYQLRYPEAANPTPTNTVAAATDPTRFNICGQCHHSRGRDWTSTSRGPHHSVQTNIYVGEAPVPDGTEPLVLSRVSVHSFAPSQCATCHMYREEGTGEQPTISGHKFTVNLEACANTGCHPSMSQATAAKTTVQDEMQARLDDIATRLGNPSTWQYSAEGGPTDQSGISDNIKKVRFIYDYVSNDGSLGVHNPDYVRDLLVEAQDLLTEEGL